MKKIILISILSGIASSSFAIDFMRPQLDEIRSHIQIGASLIFGPSVKFSNMGNIPYPVDETGDIEYLFNDGFIDINESGNQKTSNFGFRMSEAKYDEDQKVTSFELNRYRAGAEGLNQEVDSDSSYGWEISYQYDFKSEKKSKWGYILSLGVSNIDFSYQGTVNGALYTQKAIVDVSGLDIPYTSGGSYLGASEGPAIDLSNDLNFDPNTETVVTQEIWGGEGTQEIPSNVDSDYELDGMLLYFRAGPTYKANLFNDCYLQMSVGGFIGQFKSDYTIKEKLSNINNLGNNEESAEENYEEWLFGAYADVSLQYYLNKRTALFVSYKMNFIGDPDERQVSDITAEVSLSGAQMAGFGLSIKY